MAYLPTKYMNLKLPIPGVTKGPTWAEMLNEIFDKIDAHDHSPGFGAPLSFNNINIGSSVDMNGYGIMNAGFLQLGYMYGTPDTPATLFNYKGDLWYQYNSTGISTGAFAQITAYDSVFSRTSCLEPLYISFENSPYTIDATEKISGAMVDTSTGAVTINLSQSGTYPNGKFFLIQDVTGNASTNNITVTPDASDAIGLGTAGTSHVINSDYGYVWITCYGAGNYFPILTSA